jgi:hypothetical protein
MILIFALLTFVLESPQETEAIGCTYIFIVKDWPTGF